MHRLVKVIRGKGHFAVPTGAFEIGPALGVIPHVIATDRPEASNAPMGFFLANFPRVISVARYRVVQVSSPARPDWAVNGYFGVAKLPDGLWAEMGPDGGTPFSKS